MCGINGFNWDDENLIKQSTNLLNHRGPDQEGFYIDEKISLGHKRLSILDLSENGRQPMHNEDETIWIVYNGEIYNFKILRQKLEKLGHNFYSNTDTEVIVHSYEENFTNCLNHFNGQFSLCIYDKNRNILFLARDRLGIKPLYYYYRDGKFIFASELKSILKTGINKAINFQSLKDYFTFGYIQGKESILKNVFRVEPGHYLIFNLKKMEIENYSKYWDVDFSKKIYLKEEDYCKVILKLFEESVSKRLVADVPVGAFLSGGIDSSAIVAMISKYKKDLNTFSIRFAEQEFDESKFAKIVSEKFGTNHHEIIFSSKDVRDLIDNLVYYYDEPFSDPSMIPTYLVSQVAKKYVKVSLSGDGGDELFAGYKRYIVSKVGNYIKKLPNFVIKYGFNPLFEPFSRITHRDGIKFLKFAQYQNHEMFARILSPIDDSMKFLNINFKNKYEKFRQFFKYGDYLDNIQNADIHNYLPDDIFTKTDRASLGVSLEVRVPFIDHHLVEFVSKIPAKYKLNKFETKYILKKAFLNILPKKIIYREKHGFDVPLKYYFKKELRDILIENIIENKDHNFFNKKYLKDILNKEMNNNIAKMLWIVLFFNLWYEKWFLN